VGLFDALLGRRKVAGPAKTDRLFAITTAYVTLQTSFEITSRGAAALVFQPLATADFSQIVRDTEEIVRATGSETGTTVTTSDDQFGVNAVSESLEAGGYGDRLLCAVFPFKERRGPLYLIYNYKRGSWYPFVPAGDGHERVVERELQLKAQIGQELPIEPELERWFPLWGVPV